VVTPTEAGKGRTAADPSDPGARLLLRIGDFIEPLTRFNRRNLSMTESRHEAVQVMVRQAFRIVFETRTRDRNGPLPAGVKEKVDAEALDRESRAQLSAARIALPRRLSTWAEAHGEDMTARPTVETCFGESSPLGYVETCSACHASGRITCSLCHGDKQVTCETCRGHGATDCETCHKAGTIACKTCRGVGTITERGQRKKWDEAANTHYVEHYQETLACPACNKLGVVKCPKCAGVGALTCKTCDGRKTVPCSQCKGTGSTRCQTCDGHGSRHHVTELTCSINETTELSTRAADGEIAAGLKARGGVDDILAIAASHHSIAEANNNTITRDTIVVVPVTSVMVALDDKRAMIHAFGARQEVPDYRNIAGLLMSDDIDALESANAESRLLPPQVPDRMYDALSNALASEINVELVTTGANRTSAESARNYRGVMTADYVARAGEAIRTGVSRAYWTGIARGPALVLSLPILFAPLDLFLRNSGAGVRVGVLLFVMAATFGGAVAGHYWVIRQLQRRIAPGGAPKVMRVIDAIGLTMAWLVTGGAIAVLLSLLVAGMTSWAFPPS
jgi:hypothetical protein